MCTDRTNYLCVSIEYEGVNEKCNLQSVTPLDVPNAWIEDVYGFNVSYFQRNCI